jgi:hypothetical protein
MPRYLLRFTADSCLNNDTDIVLSNRDVDVRFLFSKRQPDDGKLRVELQIDAANNRDAQARASGELLPLALDALSFTTGTPLLLSECELILKDESGSDLRRAIYVAHKSTPTKVALPERAVEEASQILKSDSASLAICWHRYALDRQLPLDQFVFNWLAFEALAGDAEIASRCSRCGEALSHCDVPVSHTGSSKNRAAEIFCAANPETTPQEFTSKIWNTARNKVFHGRRYPNPKFLAEIFTVSQQLRKASEAEIAKLAGVAGNKPNHRYEELFRIFYFVQWRTKDSARPFADDWPETELIRMKDAAEIGRVYVHDPVKYLKLLGYAQSSDW